MAEWVTLTVHQLQDRGVLFVEDGNHGEYRPLADEFVAEGVPFVRPPDLIGGRVDLSTCDKINEVAFARVRKGIGRGGDVLFTHRATVGRLAAMPPDAPTFVCNPGVTVWRCLDPGILDRRFLYYWMHSAAFMDQVWAAAGGADTFPYIGLMQQRELLVAIPPLPEQQAIAAVLGALDDKIELNRRMNRTLEEMARAVFRSWFVDFDPIHAKAEGRAPAHMDPATAALFPARLGEDGLPEGWTGAGLLDVAELISGGTPKTGEPMFWDGEIAWASAKDVSQCGQLFLIETERNITDLGLQKSSTKIVPALSTAVVARGATTGRFCMFGRAMAMNQTCYALRSKSGAPVWLNCLFGSLVNELTQAAHGSTFDTITTSTLRGARIVRPDREVVQAFETTAHQWYAKALGNIEQSRTLAALRDALLPKLMSGELRVRDAERALAEAV